MNAQCNNTLKSFYCTCLRGYSGDGVNCSGIYIKHTTTHYCCSTFLSVTYILHHVLLDNLTGNRIFHKDEYVHYGSSPDNERCDACVALSFRSSVILKRWSAPNFALKLLIVKNNTIKKHLVNEINSRFRYNAQQIIVVVFFSKDVDECQDQTHNCDVNAQCNNTLGSFNCVCLQGYSGDGVNCSGLMNHTVIYYSPHIIRAIVVVYLQS